jgi:hypothetical protein
MNRSMVGFTAAEINTWQEKIKGQVILPGDADYDRYRQAWNLIVDQHPAVIVVVENAADIQHAVQFAGSHNLDIAVKSTGHGVARPADGSLLIITAHLQDIHIDPDAQTAWLGAGLKWGPVLAKTQEYGLAPLLGSSPDVGVIGYTLGGGLGWLARKYGLATDSVMAFELVTADGQLKRASASENPDLFWGLRGGGGNFGVITSMEIKLYPVTTVYGGNLFYPPTLAREVFRRYRDWVAQAPEELTSSIVLMNVPDIPDLPDFLRGKSFVIVRGCYIGPVEQGEALLQPWREWQAPLMDDFKAMPFAQVATISNDPEGPLPGLSSGAWLHELSDAAVEVLIQFGQPDMGSSPLTVTEIRHAGGAVKRGGETASAYGNREAEHIMQLIGVTPTPEINQALRQYVSKFLQELNPHLTGGVYLNFLEGAEVRERTRAGFSPQTFQRLQSLKRQVDPNNRFSHSFDIQPE